MLSMLEYSPEPVEGMEIPPDFRVSGWVYVLSNECMPGIYKIGMTTTDPETRAKEISQGTGVPAPFAVVRAYYSQNPREDELVIHEELAEYRFNPNREFFNCSLEDIENCMSSNGLFRRGGTVAEVADDFHIISFERNEKLILDDLFDSLGINVFGDRLAVAERLIEMAVNTVKRLREKGMSLVFSRGLATPIVSNFHREWEAAIMQEAKIEAETGIYGPSLPDNDIPF